VTEWLQQLHVTTLDWPSQSPDLNIIVPLLDDLSKMLRGQTDKNTAEKFEQLKFAWSSIA
jgi:hypothetical protein